MDETFSASDRSNDTSAIMIPPDAFGNETANSGTEVGVVFSRLSSADLYPLADGTMKDFAIASQVISATVVGMENMISSNITIVLQLNYEVKNFFKYLYIYFIMGVIAEIGST